MAGVNGSIPREQRAVQDARDFILFCDGLEEAGLVDYARRGRNVARELEWAVPALLDERRLRVVMQQSRDEAREVLRRRIPA